MITRIILLATAITAASACLGVAQPKPANYDESKVGNHALPDTLVCSDGTKVTDAKTWREKRRPELLELFRKQMHGRSPKSPTLKFDVAERDAKALGGLATRKQIAIRLGAAADSPTIDLLLYVPNEATRPAPVVLGVNFDGNHTIHSDKAITIAPVWVWDAKDKTSRHTTPDESSRGSAASRWQLETLLKRGYAVATIARHNIEPDYAEGWKHGIRGHLLKQSGKNDFADDDWGAIAAWAWGLSRAMDYLESDRDCNARQVAVVGHSRLGKAALWAGAEDERFAIIVSNNSGEGGASLARRNYGETTAVINNAFPHWFCRNYKQYGGAEEKLPFDAHSLVALTAPRPVYIASAEEDRWADPKGEFLAAKHAEPVYALFDKKGLGADEWPGVNKPVGGTLGYHMRDGKHDINAYDWEQYLAFFDRHLGRK